MNGAWALDTDLHIEDPAYARLRRVYLGKFNNKTMA